MHVELLMVECFLCIFDKLRRETETHAARSRAILQKYKYTKGVFDLYSGSIL